MQIKHSLDASLVAKFIVCVVNLSQWSLTLRGSSLRVVGEVKRMLSPPTESLTEKLIEPSLSRYYAHSV